MRNIKPKKTKMFSFRATPEEIESIRSASRRLGIPPSTLVRQLAIAAIAKEKAAA